MTKETDEKPDVLTVEEARARLRIGKNAIYDALARNEIPNIRIGRKYFVPRVAFERMLAGEGPALAAKTA